MAQSSTHLSPPPPDTQNRMVKATCTCLCLHYVSVPGTPWDSWPLYLKPIAFFATVIQVAFLPHVFARQLPATPRLGWALFFGGICFLSLIQPPIYHLADVGFWMIGALCSLLLQSTCFSIIFSSRLPWTFWLTVCLYTSFPMLLEPLIPDDEPFPLPGFLWPYTQNIDAASVAIFCLWWIDLVVICWIKARPTAWWEPILAGISVPLISAAIPLLIMGMVWLIVL